jgi:uncharacterized protein
MPNKTTTRRRNEQAQQIAAAQAFAGGLDPALDVRAVVVFGSVARGDFNLWSDIDVVVVAGNLPPRLLDRLTAVGSHPRVQPVPWTPDEWATQRHRRNPIVVESLERGVWLVGRPEDLAA